MTLYCSHWPSHVPRPEEVGGGYPHTIVCFGFLGLASRAALLTALLQDNTHVQWRGEGEGEREGEGEGKNKRHANPTYVDEE